MDGFYSFMTTIVGHSIGKYRVVNLRNVLCDGEQNYTRMDGPGL